MKPGYTKNMSKNKASEINISITLKKDNKIVHHMVKVGIKITLNHPR